MPTYKNKTVAALLAIFLGQMGVHRFYLGQFWGILYFIPVLGSILGLIDGISLFVMDQQSFDYKYNREYLDIGYKTNQRDFEWRRAEEQRRKAMRQKEYQSYTTSKPKQDDEFSILKKAGIIKFRKDDYCGAIDDFNRALEYDEDNAIHFNLACAYSITEEKDNAYQHLSKAVELGFNDFNRISNHEALAFLRIQPDYNTFVKNGYNLSPIDGIFEEKPIKELDLLDQLEKLAELKEKGILSDEEFFIQKRKLLD